MRELLSEFLVLFEPQRQDEGRLLVRGRMTKAELLVGTKFVEVSVPPATGSGGSALHAASLTIAQIDVLGDEGISGCPAELWLDGAEFRWVTAGALLKTKAGSRTFEEEASVSTVSDVTGALVEFQAGQLVTRPLPGP